VLFLRKHQEGLRMQTFKMIVSGGTKVGKAGGLKFVFFRDIFFPTSR